MRASSQSGPEAVVPQKRVEEDRRPTPKNGLNDDNADNKNVEPVHGSPTRESACIVHRSQGVMTELSAYEVTPVSDAERHRLIVSKS